MPMAWQFELDTTAPSRYTGMGDQGDLHPKLDASGFTDLRRLRGLFQFLFKILLEESSAPFNTQNTYIHTHTLCIYIYIYMYVYNTHFSYNYLYNVISLYWSILYIINTLCVSDNFANALCTWLYMTWHSTAREMGATYGSARVSCAFYNTKARLGIFLSENASRFKSFLGFWETNWLWSVKSLTGRDRQVAWMHFFISLLMAIWIHGPNNALRVSECLK